MRVRTGHLLGKIARALVVSFALHAIAGDKIEVAAYYFGNYHVDPRNEAHLGKGWTEWDYVRHAKPQFPGHLQPRVPLWGYTDEADPRAMAQKIDAAADHGVGVFLFDWYDYNGPFLQRTIDEGFLKAANRNRIKFALMWANHAWTELQNAAPGKRRPVLYPPMQKPEEFERIGDHIIKSYFSQPNYWRIDGKPYFSIYELPYFVAPYGSLEKARTALERFRAKARAAGLPGVHLNLVYWGDYSRVPGVKPGMTRTQVLDYLGFDSASSYVWVHHAGLPRRETDYDQVKGAYAKFWDGARKELRVPYFPNVTVGWDSNPRAFQEGPWSDCWGYPYSHVIVNNTPAKFRQALAETKAKLLADPKGPRVVMINSWNEWTEGSYLEPDTRYGYGYLQAIRDVFGPVDASAEAQRKGGGDSGARPSFFEGAEWLWHPNMPGPNSCAFFRTMVTLPAELALAQLAFSCDNGGRLMINGREVVRQPTGMIDWHTPAVAYDVRAYLKPGENLIEVEAMNLYDQAGFIGAFEYAARGETKLTRRVTNRRDWKVAGGDHVFVQPISYGRYGTEPWGRFADRLFMAR